MRFENQTFSDQEVLLDGNQFVGVTFEDCRLVFAGIMPITLDSCSFRRCSWGFAGPAQNAVQFMTSMYALGGEGERLVEGTFRSIREGAEGFREA